MVSAMIPTVSDRLVPVFVLAASVLALASALVAQYLFGLQPCILCLIQRVPFAIAGGLAALALVARARPARVLMALAGLAFLVNSGVAVYHVGVERGLWQSSCVPTESGPVVVDDLAALMSQKVEARCDEPAWQWRGITMAGLNIVFSGGLALITLALARRMEVRR